MRDHIDFIQAQALPWQDAAPWGLSRARLKLLSEDDETRAISTILSLPSDWSRPEVTYDFDEEIYVLDGQLQIGDLIYSAHCYAFLPAGSHRNDIRTSYGATLLYFRSEVMEYSIRSDPAKIASRCVRHIDVSAGQWDGDFDRFGLGSMKAGARMRVLRQDPFSGETTYITATIAFRRGEQAERHPIAQEFFMLSGELAGPRGTMQAGAYCIRPPMAKHAPYGSPTGALILFRGFGGSQETFWEDTDPFTFYPEHDPILPDHLKPLSKPYPPQTRY